MTNKAQNNVRNAASKAQAAKAPAKGTTKSETPADDNAKFIGKIVKCNGGRKHNGETLKCFAVTKGSSFRQPSALCEGAEALKQGDTPIFIQPKFLEIVGDMDKADLARLLKMQEEQRNATVYVTAFTRGDSAITDKAMRLSNKEWPSDIWFSNDMVATTGTETPEGEKIFEVAAWKIKKSLGLGMYNMIVKQQDALAAVVNAG